MEEVTGARFASQAQRTGDFLDRLTGTVRSSIDRIREMGRGANGPAYERAHAEADNLIRQDANAFWTPELQRLSRAPTIRDMMLSIGPREGDRTIIAGHQSPRENPFVVNGETGNIVPREITTGKTAAVPDLNAWDAVQRQLRNAAGAASRSGRDEESRRLGLLRRDLVRELDRINPAFRDARGTAFQGFRAEDAFEAGENYVRMKPTGRAADELRQTIENMSATDRVLFMHGFANKLIGDIRNTADNVDIVRKIYNSPEARARIVESLGPRRARELEAFLHVEQVMNRSRRAVSGGSTTARQLADASAAGAITDIGYSAVTGEQPWSPGAVLSGAAGATGRHFARRADSRIADRVGEMLSSNDPNVFQRGITIIAQNNRLMNRLRDFTNNRLGAPQIGEQSSGASLLPAPGTINLPQRAAGNDDGTAPFIRDSAGRAYNPTDGKRQNPVSIETPDDLHRGAENTASPTPAQAEAGNYQKRHMTWKGLPITIETETGQERAGVGADGKPWSTTMANPYGYIKGTTGRDGDQVDVYMGAHPHSQHVFVVDQIDPKTGTFDEHKAVLGTGTAQEAASIYDAGFSDASGPTRRGAMHEMTIPAFKAWIAKGDTRKPLAYREPAMDQSGLPLPEYSAESPPTLKQLFNDPRSAREIRKAIEHGRTPA
jgi:hypothetical protein